MSSKGVMLGFSAGDGDADEYERMKAKVQQELKNALPSRVPQPHRRHRGVPPAHEDEIVQIVDLMAGNLDDRLRERDMGIELTLAAKELLAERGYDPALGARPLRRTIQREVEDALSEKILFGELRPGQIVVVDVEGTGPTATFTVTGTDKVTLPDAPPVEPAGASGEVVEG